MYRDKVLNTALTSSDNLSSYSRPS